MKTITDPKLINKVVDHITELSAEDLAKLATHLFGETYTYIGETGDEGFDTFRITPTKPVSNLLYSGYP